MTAPDGLTRAFFTPGGSGSVETALRPARQDHKVRGQPGRVKFLSLRKGCHRIPAPCTYPARRAALCLRALEDAIAFQGAETIAAFIMEPVLGTGGMIVPDASFMRGLAALCRRQRILRRIAHAVITAFGRTGAWSGSRLWGVQPDVMCTAQAMTNGDFPFGAVMIAKGGGGRCSRTGTRSSATGAAGGG